MNSAVIDQMKLASTCISVIQAAIRVCVSPADWISDLLSLPSQYLTARTKNHRKYAQDNVIEKPKQAYSPPKTATFA